MRWLSVHAMHGCCHLIPRHAWLLRSGEMPVESTIHENPNLHHRIARKSGPTTSGMCNIAKYPYQAKSRLMGKGWCFAAGMH
jgi:hypothetical protein